MKLKAVQLRVKRGINFPGETCGIPEEVADRMIASGEAFALDEKGNPIKGNAAPDKPKKKRARKAAPKKDEKPSGESQGTQGPDDDKDQLQIDKFVLDGFDQGISDALRAAGLEDPEQVMEYLAAGKSLAEIEGISPANEKSLVEAYSVE